MTLQVTVRNNNVKTALRILKKKLEQDGQMMELRRRQFYEKPSEKKREAKKQSIRRVKKREKERRRDEDL
jgi:small subunit ribosomal protein S21|tara:strand:+ start:198 stop:407 length:210 start_codon:yes stop_codon:yes gene_type:complete